MSRIIILLVFLCQLSGAQNKIFPDWYYDFFEWEPVKYMFMDNQFALIHMGGSAFEARILTEPAIMKDHTLTPEQALWVVFGTGLFVEVIEVKVEGTHEVYGSTERWLYDTTGDMICNMFGAAMAVRYVGQSYSIIKIEHGLIVSATWEL